MPPKGIGRLTGTDQAVTGRVRQGRRLANWLWWRNAVMGKLVAKESHKSLLSSLPRLSCFAGLGAEPSAPSAVAGCKCRAGQLRVTEHRLVVLCRRACRPTTQVEFLRFRPLGRGVWGWRVKVWVLAGEDAGATAFLLHSGALRDITLPLRLSLRPPARSLCPAFDFNAVADGEPIPEEPA
jgi:hypothetical protein